MSAPASFRIPAVARLRRPGIHFPSLLISTSILRETMARDGDLADDTAEQDGVAVRALWPWALFVATLLAGLAAFFVLTPR